MPSDPKDTVALPREVVEAACSIIHHDNCALSGCWDTCKALRAALDAAKPPEPSPVPVVEADIEAVRRLVSDCRHITENGVCAPCFVRFAADLRARAEKAEAERDEARRALIDRDAYAAGCYRMKTEAEAALATAEERARVAEARAEKAEAERDEARAQASNYLDQRDIALSNHGEARAALKAVEAERDRLREALSGLLAHRLACCDCGVGSGDAGKHREHCRWALHVNALGIAMAAVGAALAQTTPPAPTTPTAPCWCEHGVPEACPACSPISTPPDAGTKLAPPGSDSSPGENATPARVVQSAGTSSPALGAGTRLDATDAPGPDDRGHISPSVQSEQLETLRHPSPSGGHTGRASSDARQTDKPGQDRPSVASIPPTGAAAPPSLMPCVWRICDAKPVVFVARIGWACKRHKDTYAGDFEPDPDHFATPKDQP